MSEVQIELQDLNCSNDVYIPVSTFQLNRRIMFINMSLEEGQPEQAIGYARALIVFKDQLVQPFISSQECFLRTFAFLELKTLFVKLQKILKQLVEVNPDQQDTSFVSLANPNYSESDTKQNQIPYICSGKQLNKTFEYKEIELDINSPLYLTKVKRKRENTETQNDDKVLETPNKLKRRRLNDFEEEDIKVESIINNSPQTSMKHYELQIINQMSVQKPSNYSKLSKKEKKKIKRRPRNIRRRKKFQQLRSERRRYSKQILESYLLDEQSAMDQMLEELYKL